MSADLGKLLILGGAFLIGIGALLLLWRRVPWLGRLPGDLSFQWGNVGIFVPLATSILLSLLLTLLLNLILRR